MTRTFEIIKNIVDSMNTTIKVNNIVWDVVSVCKTLHIRNGSIVTDSLGNEYKVIDFENDSFIQVEPLGLYTFTGTVVNAPKPIFIQGKWISTNNEYLAMDADTRNKTPLIWLVRGYEETHNGDLNAVKMNVSPIIYFLDEANFNSWLNEDHDTEAVNPMYNLAELFVKTVKKSYLFSEIESYGITDEPRFGVEIGNNKGNSKRILSDDLSGVRLNLPLGYNGDKCKNC